MKVRRKIMALGTALAMAFVMIASLVMVTDVKAAEINEINLDVSTLAPNTTFTAEQALDESKAGPEVSVPSGANYKVGARLPIKYMPTVDPQTGQIEDWGFETGPDDYPMTTKDGEYYYFEISVIVVNQGEWDPDQGCVVGGDTFAPNTKVNIKGVEDYLVNPNCAAGGVDYYLLYVKVKCSASQGGGDDQGGDDQGGGSDQGGSADQGDSGQAATSTSNIVTLTNGASATVAQADDGTVSFRYEKDFSYFENGGKLYIDGEEVPSDQYTARQGSTIITLLKQYASKLLDGKEHTVKAVFKDGEAIESKITVTPSAAAKATTATTTKVASPKTADVLPIAGIALVFVGATAIGVIAYRRKNL